MWKIVGGFVAGTAVGQPRSPVPAPAHENVLADRRRWDAPGESGGRYVSEQPEKGITSILTPREGPVDKRLQWQWMRWML